MTATSAGDLVRLLQECRLLEQSHVDELQRTPQALDVDVPTLTQCLVQLGWVTPYQVDQVLKGAGELLNLGPYRVLECLGESPTGATFKARHTGSKAVAVLKIIRADLLADPTILERWQEEVRLAAKLLHPYLGQVREVQQPIEGLHAYVRDFIDGSDLGALVREKGPQGVASACDVIRQASQGLHRAHMEGLTHRHIQPSNLIATQGTNGIGPVKVVDLGLGMLQEPRKTARPADRGATRVADIDDVRMDLEGLGKTFQFLLAGSADAPLPASVPADVQTIIRGMIGTGIERFRNLSDVARVLEPFCTSGPAAAAEIPMATAVNPPPPEPAAPPPAPEPVATAAPPVDDTPAAEAPPAEAPPAEAVPAGFFGESPEAEAIAASLNQEAVADAIPEGQAVEPPALAEPVEEPAPSPFQTAAVTEEEETTPFLREKAKKYGTGFWVWAVLGLLLHLVALGILIVVIIRWSNEEKKSGPKGRGAIPSPRLHV